MRLRCRCWRGLRESGTPMDVEVSVQVFLLRKPAAAVPYGASMGLGVGRVGGGHDRGSEAGLLSLEGGVGGEEMDRA
jgi:hypothetical protein